MAGSPPITIQVFGDTDDIEQKLSKIKGSLGGLGGATDTASKSAIAGFGKIAAAIGAVLAAFKTVGAAAGLVGKSMAAAADAETIKTQFETILGSADAASARFEELAKFGEKTPFELNEVAKASKTLETLTRGALSTGDGLTMVGDVAAATGESFQGIAVHVGRLYDGLQSGRPVGEAMARLQELGIMSGSARGQIEKLQKEGKKGDAVWSVAAAELGQFGGAMDKLSGTWGGMVSNLKEGIDGVLRAFGAPLLDALKPVLEGSIGLIEKLLPAAQAAASKIGEAIRRLTQAGKAIISLFQSGDLTKVAFTALSLGFKKAINQLATTLVTALRIGANHFLGIMALATRSDFWVGLFKVIQGVSVMLVGTAAKFTAGILEGGADFITPLVAGVVYVGDKLISAFRLGGLVLKSAMLRAVEAFLSKLKDAPLIGEGAGSLSDAAGGEADKTEAQMVDVMKSMNKTWAETMEEVEEGMSGAVDSLRGVGDAANEIGGSLVTEGGGAAAQAFNDEYLTRMMDAIKKTAPVQVFDESGELASLRDTLGKFFTDAGVEGLDKAGDKVKKGEGGGDATSGSKTNAIVSDSLSSIGGGGGFFAGSNTAAAQLSVSKSMDSSLRSIDNKLGKSLVVTV